VDEAMIARFPLTCQEESQRFAGMMDYMFTAPVGVAPDFGCVMWEAKP
jgi:hypothetical protein